MIGIISLTLLIGFGFIFSVFQNKNSNQSRSLPDHEFENWEQAYELTTKQAEWVSLFDKNTTVGYDQLMQFARTGRVSLVSELWKMRRKCPPQMNLSECNSLLQTYLLQKFPVPDNKKFAKLLKDYLRYEEEMTKFRIPNDLGVNERYYLIQKKRRAFFGTKKAHLLFGLEEAKYNFYVAMQAFDENNLGMSGNEKIKAYKNVRRRSYKIYYKSVVKREPIFIKYLTEVKLRDNDFKKLNATGRSLLIRELRIKYFGKKTTLGMEKIDGSLGREYPFEGGLQKSEAQLMQRHFHLSTTSQFK